MRYLYRTRPIERGAPPLPPAFERYVAAAQGQEARVRRRAAMAALAEACHHMSVTPRGEVEKSIYGKPYFTESDYHFNLSHAGDLAVAVLADCRVGVDIEPYDREIPEERRERLTSLFTDGERARLKVTADRARTFLEIWVRKEALAKRSGRGIADLASADTAATPPTHEERVWHKGREYYLAIY
ncbi:MAG: 4'-phosphopantetheinyl transferase superfamily protein [Clostridia bacterium]|nr:4'-phosphopantetheinyl transferase superfamily protein [Clostridia bacterium]